TGGGTLTILENAFISDNTSLVVANIAQGICDYWSSITATGDPAHGGIVVNSVTIDGAAVLTEMKAAISGVITDTAVADAWLAFYQATEAVVKTIPCTINEEMPGTPTYPQDFSETIS
ncbi:MAG: hypothetical protein HUJ30_08295, partial [Gammaproteobacteria bacterium]|nr:hypothetical protein [Gammaproteobacteria bacterium]